MKRLRVTLNGTQQTYYSRLLIVEVPDDYDESRLDDHCAEIAALVQQADADEGWVERGMTGINADDLDVVEDITDDLPVVRFGPENEIQAALSGTSTPGS